MAAVEAGYDAANEARASQPGKKPGKKRPVAAAACKKLLISNFDVERGGGEEKARVDSLLASQVASLLPRLADELRDDASLVLLLLDAPPACASAAALLRVLPALRAHRGRICIPQADPTHYLAMIDTAAEVGGGGAPLNVTAQRLDTWLQANAARGLRVPVCFFDYETSIYGKASAGLSPLRDLQRFLRGGFAADVCLLGVTLSYREAHAGRYDGPKLEPEHVADFVATEAAAQGFGRCELLEELRYGMTFSLFLLRRGS